MAEIIEKDQSTETVHDIIDFTPDLIKVIEDEETAKIIIDDLYFPILKVLRKGPKTVKEIEEEYNEIANNKKSDKTIYRYLKTLQDAELIINAGQRVVKGKTATETLFSRTAYAFFMRNEQAEFWETKEGRNLSEALGESLTPLMGRKKPNFDKLQLFLKQFSIDRIDQLKEILSKADKSMLEGISGLDWQQFTAFYNLGGMLAVILSKPELINELRDCFE